MKKIPVIGLVILFLFLAFKFVYRSSPVSVPDDQAQLVLYWGNGCPHCENVKNYINQNKLDQKIKIAYKEVYYNKANQQELENTVKNCPTVDTSQGIGVPLAFDTQAKTCLLGDTPIIDWLKSRP